MRNLSFALTTAQMRARSKSVTRRRGVYWASVLRPFDLVCAVEKAQGIAQGELVRIAVLRVVDVRVETLDAIERLPAPERVVEVAREGFPNLTASEFVAMFRRHVGGDASQTVTRIEFEFTNLLPGGAR